MCQFLSDDFFSRIPKTVNIIIYFYNLRFAIFQQKVGES